MSFITSIISNMSEKDKEKLGRVGTKINTDGAHLLTIIDAYEIDNQRFYLKCEDPEGKTVDWTGFLKQKVGKDKDGVVKAGEYSVNGVKVYLDNEAAEYDNLRVIGQINNLWKICGLDAKQFGAGIVPGTITFAKAGVKDIETDSGKTEPVAIEASIAAAKANPSIEYKNKVNKICIQELQLIRGAGKAPVTEDATKVIDSDIF